jgi:hypothetical protein
MRKPLLALLAVVACLLVPAAASAKPPSFAAWSKAWTAKTDKATDMVGNGCIKQFGQTDAKVGACFVKGMRTTLRAETPQWDSGVVAIAAGQSAACKGAVKAYVTASRTMQHANLAYLDGHQKTVLSRVLADLKAAPYATFRATSNRAKATAVRVCG